MCCCDFLEELFVVVLNYVDFFTDVFVTLEYGCFIENELSTSCDGSEGCEPHWWWFSTALGILIVSTVVSSFYYSTSPGLCCLSLFQLSHLRDLYLACEKPDPEEIQRKRIRDMVTKMLESAPQLYLQSYVLFAVGQHRNRQKIVSVVISSLALSYGVMRFLTLDQHATRLQKATLFLFLTTDQLLRASGYALALSEHARQVGVPLILAFALLSWLLRLKADGHGALAALFSGLVAGHVVPVDSLQARLTPEAVLQKGFRTTGRLHGSELWRTVYVYYSLLPRYVEVIIYGLLGLTMARRRCGFVPREEVNVIIVLLGLNVSILVFMLCVGFERKAKVVTVPVVVGAHR